MWISYLLTDVSQLDTNLPRIDLEAIENHLQFAREEEKKVAKNYLHLFFHSLVVHDLHVARIVS